MRDENTQLEPIQGQTAVLDRPEGEISPIIEPETLELAQIGPIIRPKFKAEALQWGEFMFAQYQAHKSHLAAPELALT
jgi:hypothetical protein